MTTNLTQLDEIDRKVGEWWEPDSAGIKHSGFLQRNGDDVVLVLSGTAQGTVPFEEPRDIPVLHGFVEGQPVTLLRCYPHHWVENRHMAHGMSWRSEFMVLFLLLGPDFYSAESLFSSVSFGTNELHKIFAVRPLVRIIPSLDIVDITVKGGSNIDAEALKRSGNALFEIPDLRPFACDIDAINTHASFRIFSSVRSSMNSGPTITHHHRFVLSPREPTVANTLLSRVKEMAHLFSLVSVTPNYILDINLIAADRSKSRVAFFENGHLTPRKSSELRSTQVFFSFPKHETTWPRLINAWFATLSDHQTARYIFQSTLEMDRRLDINRYLNVMQCLEILTNIHSTSRHFSRNDFAKLCSSVETALNDSGVVGNTKALFNAFRNNSNRTNLATRLLELCDRLDKRLLGSLLGEAGVLVSHAVKARNYFTHHQGANEQLSELYHGNVGLTVCKITTLYVLLELSLIGLPADSESAPMQLPWILEAARRPHQSFNT